MRSGIQDHRFHPQAVVSVLSVSRRMPVVWARCLFGQHQHGEAKAIVPLDRLVVLQSRLYVGSECKVLRSV